MGVKNVFGPFFLPPPPPPISLTMLQFQDYVPVYLARLGRSLECARIRNHAVTSRNRPSAGGCGESSTRMFKSPRCGSSWPARVFPPCTDFLLPALIQSLPDPRVC